MVRAPQPDSLVTLMESLADDKRLRLLRLLERHELGVAELCEVLQLPQSTVSRHLKVLMDEGWLHDRRLGTNHLYRMILDELAGPQRKLWLLAREQTEAWATARQDELRLAQTLAERQRQAEGFFNGAAADWDKLRAELYGSAFSMQAMLALLPADWTVADLGCGTGSILEQIAPHVRATIGVDSSAAMLKAAKKRIGEMENVDLRRGDLAALPVDDAACDAAMMVLVLTYVADPQAALKEMSRILKPGGRAVVVDLLPHDRDDFRRQMEQRCPGFDGREMARMLSAAGLGEARVRPLPVESGAKGPALFLATATKDGR